MSLIFWEIALAFHFTPWPVNSPLLYALEELYMSMLWLGNLHLYAFGRGSCIRGIDSQGIGIYLLTCKLV